MKSFCFYTNWLSYKKLGCFDMKALYFFNFVPYNRIVHYNAKMRLYVLFNVSPI